MDGPRPLDPEQVDGLHDMDPERFRAAAHLVVDRVADYLVELERYPVLPPVEPGTIGPMFPAHAPDRPEALDAILADVDALVVPNATHWQHPGFLAYFAISDEVEAVSVSSPSQPSGRPSPSRSHLTTTVSSSVPIGEVRHSMGFCPSAAVSSSPRIPGPLAVVAK